MFAGATSAGARLSVQAWIVGRAASTRRSRIRERIKRCDSWKVYLSVLKAGRWWEQARIGCPTVASLGHFSSIANPQPPARDTRGTRRRIVAPLVCIFRPGKSSLSEPRVADLNNNDDYSAGTCELGATKIAPRSHIGHMPDEVHSAVKVILLARKMWENPAGCASFRAAAKPFQPTDFPQPRGPNPSPSRRVLSSPPMAHTSLPVRMRESPFPSSSP